MVKLVQTGSGTATSTRDVAEGSPKNTVFWSNQGEADVVPSSRGKSVLAKHPGRREEREIAAHSINEFEQGSPAQSGNELQREKFVSAEPRLMDIQETTPAVTASIDHKFLKLLHPEATSSLTRTTHAPSEKNILRIKKAHWLRLRRIVRIPRSSLNGRSSGISRDLQTTMGVKDTTEGSVYSRTSGHKKDHATNEIP